MRFSAGGDQDNVEVDNEDGTRSVVPRKFAIANNLKYLDPIEKLRQLALSLNPKHGDKLYPLEVLGAYHIVNNNPMRWNFELAGNPENFIDSQIAIWLSNYDSNKFKNRLERCLTQDAIVQKIFLLRLNYALLLEEGNDDIKIYRGRISELEGYGAVDDLGNVYGNADSSVDLIKDTYKLDEMAKAFYSKVETISSKKTGTKLSTKERIVARLAQFGYQLELDLDTVYRQLNNVNNQYLEEGLIARIAYVAFESENDGPRISWNE